MTQEESSQHDVEQVVEQLCMDVVLVDSTDLAVLADLHGRFQVVQKAAEDTAPTPSVKAIEDAIDQLEKLILSETDDVESAMKSIVRTATMLQRGFSHGEWDELVDEGDEAPEALNLPFSLPEYVDESIFSDFLSRQPEVLSDIEELVLEVGESGSTDALANLKRYLHTIKGESAMLSLGEVEKVCHTLEDHIDQDPFSTLVDACLEAKDWFELVYSWCQGKVERPESAEALLGRLFGETETPEKTEEVVDKADFGKAEEAPAAVSEPIENEVSPSSEEESEEATDEGKSVAELGGELGGDGELVGEFVQESLEHLENSDVGLLKLETDPTDGDAIDTIFRAFHTIKGVAGFLGLNEVQELAHHAENILDKSRKKELELNSVAMDAIFESVDLQRRLIGYVSESLETGNFLKKEPGLKAMISKLEAVADGTAVAAPEPKESPEPAERSLLGEALVEKGAVTTEDVDDALEKQRDETPDRRLGKLLVEAAVLSSAKLEQVLAAQKKEDIPLGEMIVKMGFATVEDIDHALKKQDGPAEAPRLGEILVRDGKVDAQEVATTIREQNQGSGAPAKAVKVKEIVKVDSDRLDRLVDMIGELVISESMVIQYPGFRENASAELAQYVGELDKITRELQEMGTSLRMVPIRPTFHKIARLIRDLSKKSGKEVNFVMFGEDTELDKSVVDRIGDPLVHMVRNAVDHGLEATAKDRIAAGKPETGTVELRAYHKGGKIHIDIEDDGRGLNREVILKKAVERGLVSDPDSMSDREVWNLIFEAGFSTAKEITEISGRGVGMDVVRRNVEALRGQIDITSTLGKGSLFSIRLPLTLAIIDGMVIRVGEQRFIIPTLSILVSIRPPAKNLSTVASTGMVLHYQNALIPIYHVGAAFGVKDCEADPTKAVIVVVEDDSGKVGFIVDELLGQQQIVIKPLGEYLVDSRGVSGGAIMPDGKVGLIVDVSGLVKLAKESEGAPLVIDSDESADSQEDDATTEEVSDEVGEVGEEAVPEASVDDVTVEEPLAVENTETNE